MDVSDWNGLVGITVVGTEANNEILLNSKFELYLVLYKKI